MKLTQLALVTVGSAALFTMTSAKAQVLADWTFANDPITTNNNPIADSGTEGQTGSSTATVSSIGMTNTYPETNGQGNSITTDDVLVGKSSDTGANGQADTGNEWRVRAAASSPNNGNGWNSAAPIATQGAVFSASTAGITSGSINVSFDWYATTQGEANMELEYTTNGTTWNNLTITPTAADTAGGLLVLTGNATDTNTVNGSYVQDNQVNSSKAGQDWFQGLTATITDPSALNDANFAIEMVNASTGADVVSTQASNGVATPLNNNSGNWRFDNISIAAAPEPSSWILGLGAVALFFGLRRIRRA